MFLEDGLQTYTLFVESKAVILINRAELNYLYLKYVTGSTVKMH